MNIFQILIFNLFKRGNERNLIQRLRGGRGGGGDMMELSPIELAAWLASNVTRRAMEFVIPTTEIDGDDENERK